MKTNTGKIAKGYAADLVLLSENPLLDIKNTTKIDTVFLAGKVLNKNKIERMLQSVRDAYGHVLSN